MADFRIDGQGLPSRRTFLPDFDSLDRHLSPHAPNAGALNTIAQNIRPISLSGNFSFTFDNNWQVSVGGAKWSGTAISLGAGGTFQMNTGAHCENLAICVDYDGGGTSPMMVSIISNVGNAAVDKYVSIRAASVTGVGLQGFSANGVGCNVFKVATGCVNTGNIPGLSTF